MFRRKYSVRAYAYNGEFVERGKYWFHSSAVAAADRMNFWNRLQNMPRRYDWIVEEIA